MSRARPRRNRRPKLTRDQEKFVNTWLDSTAVQKFEENRKTELTFADACRFWGVTENTKGEALDARLEQVSEMLLDARSSVRRR